MTDFNHGLMHRAPRPGDTIHDFSIVRRIGAGAMGVVYLAKEIKSGRIAALKLLSPLVTRDKTRRRFIREAQVVSRLRHPHIVEVYAIHESPDICYYAMEHIDGWPLSRVIQRLSSIQPPYPALTTIMKMEGRGDEDGALDPSTLAGDLSLASTLAGPRSHEESGEPKAKPLSKMMTDSANRTIVSDVWYVRQVAVMMRDVARALKYAHGTGIIHRDIKPDNLLLDQTGLLHIVDFGLARVLDHQSITLSGELMGTPLSVRHQRSQSPPVASASIIERTSTRSAW